MDYPQLHKFLWGFFVVVVGFVGLGFFFFVIKKKSIGQACSVLNRILILVKIDTTI